MTKIDLYAPETQEHWYRTYQQLRDDHPVYQVPGTDMYVLTRYDDVMYVLRHVDIFPNGTSQRRSDAAMKIYADHGVERMTPLSTNPPEHRDYRGLVDGFFDTAGAARYRGEIQRVIDDLINDFAADGTVDFMAQFALPLPVRIIGHILGFPDEDIPRLKQWSSAWVLPFSGHLTEEQEVWVAENVIEFNQYISARLAERRDDPRDDVMSSLLAATFPDGSGTGRPLTEREIITIIDHLYIGGNETTTFALTSALWILLREDGLYQQLVDDRSLIEPFIEETLRLESPTQGLYRAVARDVDMHGVTIPKGAVVHIRYAAANRDERVFADPEQVNLQRSNSGRHMAFSRGVHHCPGASLSRLEQQMALRTLLDRMANLRFGSGNDFKHAPGFVLRSLNRLHLEFDPVPTAKG